MDTPKKLVIASRTSRLAVWQAHHVRDLLQQHYPSCEIEILGLSTKGDRILDQSLVKIGGKGLFVKELELALQEGRADLAVHSLKDMPVDLPAGFDFAAILPRDIALDAFVSQSSATLADLPKGAVVGTSSLRRAAMIRARFPDLQVQSLRGNLDTRLAKLEKGEYAAIILAAVGLKRLGLDHRIRHVLSPDEMLPAVGQGALAVEISANRVDLLNVLACLHDQQTALAVAAERAVSRALGGSCEVPLAAHAVWQDAVLCLTACVCDEEGQHRALSFATQSVRTLQDAFALAKVVVADLEQQGAKEIMEVVVARSAASSGKT